MRIRIFPLSILLDGGTDIIRNVYSFLTLKEALVVRQTCGRLHAGTDAFRYSQLLVNHVGELCEWQKNMMTSGKERSFCYRRKQQMTICNLTHNDKLRAILLNESLKNADMLLYELILEEPTLRQLVW